MRYRILALIAMLAAVTRLAAGAPAAGQPQQPPWKGKNLQYFPTDIKREVLVQRMREFSFALDVRCQYCHSGGDGISFEGVDFSSDDKPAKVKARAMLRMTEEINTTLLPKIPSRAEPRVSVDCATCHHGVRLPKSLQTTLFEIATTDGTPAAIARYRALRGSDTLSGKYNFGEWEINELARRLAEAKKPDAAVAMLEMNGEFYPKSVAIDVTIGEIRLAAGDRDRALASFRQALAKAPDDARLKARIAELEKKAPEKP
jgi:hypothetical protein